MNSHSQPFIVTKLKVTEQIVAQLQESTPDEQRALILTLLDHMSPEYIIALDFAYDMTPNQKRGSKAAYTCERCGRVQLLRRVTLPDGSQATNLCEQCIGEVIRPNTAFQTAPESEHQA